MIHIKVTILWPPWFNVCNVSHRYWDKKINDIRTAITNVSLTICQCSGVLGINCLIVVILICFYIDSILRVLEHMSPFDSQISQPNQRAVLSDIEWLSIESGWSWISFQISWSRDAQSDILTRQCRWYIRIHHNHCTQLCELPMALDVGRCLYHPNHHILNS